ncbi:MAG: SbcC/MukB-like Walker B domain-containing protein, partial [Actinomycetota bacterium]
EFARFLHDKPGDRQDMLIRLLNLEVYERMRYEASRRASEAKQRMDLLQERIETDHADATAEALDSATERLKQLDRLNDEISASRPKLEAAAKAVAEAEERSEEAVRWIEILGELHVPEDISRLGDEVNHALKVQTECNEVLEQATVAVRSALETVETLPAKDPLTLAAANHELKASVAKQMSKKRSELAAAEAELKDVGAALEAATQALEDARQAEEEVRASHAAQHLAASLQVGEPCPVCLQTVTDQPKHPKVKAIASATTAVTKAKTVVEKAERAATKAKEAATQIKAAVDAGEEELARLDTALKDHPDPTAVKETLTAIETAERVLKSARQNEQEARDELTRAQKTIEKLRAREATLRADFETARDRLIPLKPPAASHKDLAADWETLTRWATEQIDVQRDAEKIAETEIKEAQAGYDEMLKALARSCADCSLTLSPGEDPLEAAAHARAGAKHEVERISNAIEQVAKMREELDGTSQRHALASSLAQHLSAKGFERWIVNEALKRLVEGATEILRDLSERQYSLTIDDKGDFFVTDHHNADESRPAKTLSGGETFLASLSLALSLSDQLLDLAAGGSARLDAIFLDEGFGTLDPETLDTVAATIENLAAKGRMVGIITHVRELAERVPVQFKVTKDANGSRVEKVAV